MLVLCVLGGRLPGVGRVPRQIRYIQSVNFSTTGTYRKNVLDLAVSDLDPPANKLGVNSGAIQHSAHILLRNARYNPPFQKPLLAGGDVRVMED
jgi:hypothetical protein